MLSVLANKMSPGSTGDYLDLLRQQSFLHFTRIDDADRSVTGGKQLFLRVDPEEGVNCRGPVIDAERIVLGFARGRVGRTEDATPLDTTPGHDDAEDFGPMIPAGVAIDLWGTAKL